MNKLIVSIVVSIVMVSTVSILVRWGAPVTITDFQVELVSSADSPCPYIYNLSAALRSSGPSHPEYAWLLNGTEGSNKSFLFWFKGNSPVSQTFEVRDSGTLGIRVWSGRTLLNEATSTYTETVVSCPPPELTVTPSPDPSHTPAPLPTSPESTPSPPIPEGVLLDKAHAEYVPIPAGPFFTGHGEELQEKSINYDYWITRHEITYQQWSDCQENGPCEERACIGAGSCESLCGSTSTDEHLPVCGITWSQAKQYAEYVNGELPTSDEWEKACRGADISIYPWGNDISASEFRQYMNYSDTNLGASTEVMSFKDGEASQYKVYDMLGNVTEFTLNDRVTQAEWGLEVEERGGNYQSLLGAMRCDRQVFLPANNAAGGFRVVITDTSQLMSPQNDGTGNR